MTDMEISMILDTYMYLDYKEAADGMTLNEILKDLSGMPDCQEGGVHYGEYRILSQVAENPDIGELQIGCQSHLLGYDNGTAACTFTSLDGQSTYVVYRGTGDGEWPDNGIGMTESSTLQQERALDYFETVVETQEIKESETLIITGHSKGGNKAQYVTMSTQYDELLDACYSIDGQGFSEKAIAKWQKEDPEGYNKRIEKITGVYGENDYVNGLGISLVQEDKIYLIQTPVKKENFAGYHDIKYMFASLEKDKNSGELTTVFHGTKNDYVSERGALGSYALVLSAMMMELEPEKRDGCAASLMQLMELGGSQKTGMNGERLTLSDIRDFREQAMTIIGNSLFGTGQGLHLLEGIVSKPSFSEEMKGKLSLKVNIMGMREQIQKFRELEAVMERYRKEAETVLEQLPRVMKNSWLLCNKLKRELKQIEKEIRQLNKMAGQLEESIRCYKTGDEEAAEQLRNYAREYVKERAG